MTNTGIRQYSPSRKQLAACIMYTKDVFIFILSEVKGASGTIVLRCWLVDFSFPEQRSSTIIKRCFSFSQCISGRRFLFFLPAPYPAHFDSPHFLPSFRVKKTPALHARSRWELVVKPLCWDKGPRFESGRTCVFFSLPFSFFFFYYYRFDHNCHKNNCLSRKDESFLTIEDRKS